MSWTEMTHSDARQSKEGLARLLESPQAKNAIRVFSYLPDRASLHHLAVLGSLITSGNATVGFRIQPLGPMVSYAPHNCKSVWHILRTTNIFLNTRLLY